MQKPPTGRTAPKMPAAKVKSAGQGMEGKQPEQKGYKVPAKRGKTPRYPEYKFPNA